MKEIYFIRHGQASFGSQNYDQLSILGKKQSQFLGQYFAKNKVFFDIVFSGSLKRQIQTARWSLKQTIGSEQSHPIINTNFNEINSSDLILNKFSYAMQIDHDLCAVMENINYYYGAIGKIFDIAAKCGLMQLNKDQQISEFLLLKQRVEAGIDNLLAELVDGSRALIFTSGSPVAVAVGYALDLAEEKILNLGFEIRNSSITVMRFDASQLKLTMFNCVAHLETQSNPNLITYI